MLCDHEVLWGCDFWFFCAECQKRSIEVMDSSAIGVVDLILDDPSGYLFLKNAHCTLYFRVVFILTIFIVCCVGLWCWGVCRLIFRYWGPFAAVF